jgi:hypothetical protein
VAPTSRSHSDEVKHARAHPGRVRRAAIDRQSSSVVRTKGRRSVPPIEVPKRTLKRQASGLMSCTYAVEVQVDLHGRIRTCAPASGGRFVGEACRDPDLWLRPRARRADARMGTHSARRTVTVVSSAPFRWPLGIRQLPRSLRRRLVPQIEGVCVVRPREGEMPATGVRHVDDGWPWPASHLAVDHVGRTREPGVDLQVT